MRINSTNTISISVTGMGVSWATCYNEAWSELDKVLFTQRHAGLLNQFCQPFVQTLVHIKWGSGYLFVQELFFKQKFCSGCNPFSTGQQNSCPFHVMVLYHNGCCTYCYISQTAKETCLFLICSHTKEHTVPLLNLLVHCIKFTLQLSVLHWLLKKGMLIRCPLTLFLIPLNTVFLPWESLPFSKRVLAFLLIFNVCSLIWAQIKKKKTWSEFNFSYT